MKKLLFFSITVILSMSLFAQDANFEPATIQHGVSTSSFRTYRLFPTQNMWTFIKLNTRNGLMWQVQYHSENEKRFEAVLNLLPLVNEEQEVDNRFTLYPTENLWTFILLDQINGKTWQVQWSLEPENRRIWIIE